MFLGLLLSNAFTSYLGGDKASQTQEGSKEEEVWPPGVLLPTLGGGGLGLVGRHSCWVPLLPLPLRDAPQPHQASPGVVQPAPQDTPGAPPGGPPNLPGWVLWLRACHLRHGTPRDTGGSGHGARMRGGKSAWGEPGGVSEERILVLSVSI